MPYIEGVARKQTILFPEAINDYIEEDNPVQFIDAFVDSLDLVALVFTYSIPESTGRPPYNPADMLKLYIYGYLNRIRSSRSLEKETKRNVEVMWLLGKLTPDFKTIADFRKDNKDAIKKVCKEFILLCNRLDLFGGELIAIDSSKFRAVNSKKRNFNEAKLEKALEKIEEKIEQYFTELEDNDQEEAQLNRPTVEDIKAKIVYLKERKGKYQELLEKLKETGKTQVSLTDPDSRAMVNNQRVEVCYNVQTTVDSKHKLIIDYETTNEVLDRNQLSQMSKRAKEILKVEKLEVLADKGYYDAIEIKECIDNGIIPYVPEPKSAIPEDVDIYHKDEFKYDTDKDCYICPQGDKLTYRNRATHHGRVMKLYKSESCKRCPILARCTRNKQGRIIYRWEHEEVLEEMRERVRREPDKVKMRNLLTEHIFGTMKRGFNQGYMLLKGKEKVSAEISLTVLSYNIKRVLNIIGLDRLKEAVFMGVTHKNNIINGAKERLSYTLRFLCKKINKIISLTELRLLYL